jgi:type II secretory pathway pseudopilin PulG
MSPSLRSEGWTVRPSFVPYGPTSPVTLLADETGLTQLAGEPAVVWQTPWEELANIQLMRFARGMALFATAAGVRYCWRTASRRDYDQLSEILAAHGGLVVRQKRRGAVYAVVAVVLVASLAAGIVAWFSGGSSGAKEQAAASAINLTLKDLPSTFSTIGATPLAALFPSSTSTVATTTTTTTATGTVNKKFEKIVKQFDTCMGVSNAKDRVYGTAGQVPLYQETSKFFTSSEFNGIQLASTAQYYDTNVKVHKDTAEMSEKPFGTCFVESQALILKTYAQASASSDTSAYQPTTYERGWSRGGVTTLSLPSITGALHLVMVEITGGHYEVTLGALVASWPKTQPFISSLVSTLLSRMKSTTSSPV